MFLHTRKKQRESQKWNRALESLSFDTALCGQPLAGNSVLIVKPLACVPCCFQEALCLVSAKAIFRYGVTKHQKATRNTEHEIVVGNVIRVPQMAEVFLGTKMSTACDN